MAGLLKFLGQRHQSLPEAEDLGLSRNATALSFIRQENPQAVGRRKMHLVLTVTIEHRDDKIAPKFHSFLQRNSLKRLLLLKRIKGLPL